MRTTLLLSLVLLSSLSLVVACGGDSDTSGADGGGGSGAGTSAGTGAGEVGGSGAGGVGGSGGTGGSWDGDPTMLPRTDTSSLSFAGAFRLQDGDFGDSTVSYATGVIALNEANGSLFIAGHAQHNAVAEYPLVAPSMATEVEALPVAGPPLQPFVGLLGNPSNGNPEGLDRIDGMFVHDGQLIVNAEEWYDADGGNDDTTLVVRDADALDGVTDGYFELEGAAQAAGYLSAVPFEWQELLGGTLLTGWASNHSIISRYSVGPSLFVVDPGLLTGASSGTEGPVATTRWMSFPYGDGVYLAPDALEAQQGSASPVWNFLSKAMFAFIVPGTRTFMVLGSSGGVQSGIGYKITQDDDNLCGGYCSYAADDNYNYYWLFDVAEIVGADSPSDPQPYDYGELSVPFDDGGDHAIVGGAFDPATGKLYLTLSAAGQVGDYDRPPLVVVYDVMP